MLQMKRENFLNKVRKGVDSDLDIYIITSNVSDTLLKFTEFSNYPKLHILDITDVSIGFDFVKNCIVIVDNEKELLEQLINHKIDYFSSI